MAKHCNKTYAPFEQAASGSAIHVELWHSNDTFFGFVFCHSFSCTIEQPENTIRERLKQWYKGESSQPGRKRSQIEVDTCFVPLLQWVLSWWPNQEKSKVLAADASTLGQRFTIKRD